MPDTEIQAGEVLERHHTRKLTNRDRDIFLALLDSDEESNEALRSAFESHHELIVEGRKNS